ncbi:4756_t:CDS:1, partial [Acaulospora morrowiae]
QQSSLSAFNLNERREIRKNEGSDEKASHERKSSYEMRNSVEKKEIFSSRASNENFNVLPSQFDRRLEPIQKQPLTDINESQGLGNSYEIRNYNEKKDVTVSRPSDENNGPLFKIPLQRQSPADVIGPMESHEGFGSNEEDSDSDNSAHSPRTVDRRMSTSSTKSVASREEGTVNSRTQSNSPSISEMSQELMVHINGTKFSQSIKNEKFDFQKNWDNNRHDGQLKKSSGLEQSRKEVNNGSSGNSKIISHQQELNTFQGDRHQVMAKGNDGSLSNQFSNIGSIRQETEPRVEDDHPLQQLSELALNHEPNSERLQYQSKNFKDSSPRSVPPWEISSEGLSKKSRNISMPDLRVYSRDPRDSIEERQQPPEPHFPITHEVRPQTQRSIETVENVTSPESLMAIKSRQQTHLSNEVDVSLQENRFSRCQDNQLQNVGPQVVNVTQEMRSSSLQQFQDSSHSFAQNSHPPPIHRIQEPRVQMQEAQTQSAIRRFQEVHHLQHNQLLQNQQSNRLLRNSESHLQKYQETPVSIKENRSRSQS